MEIAAPPPDCRDPSVAEARRLGIYDTIQSLTMLKSNDSLFSLDTLFFEKRDEAENYPDNEKSLDWFLPPAPLISEIPDTQALEEEIRSHKLLGQEERPKILPSNLKITNENTNYISPTQKFQFAFSSNEYEAGDLNLGVAGNNDLSHVPGKLAYGSSQKYKNQIGTEIVPEKSVPDNTKLVNFAEDKGESTPAFRKRLFKISDNIHEDVNSNDSTNLDYPIGSVKIASTEMNKGEPWKCSSSKQKHQYSDINIFTASSTFSASEIREDIFKAPTFSLASQPHEVQGVIENDLDSLKAVTEIPAIFRSIFKEFPYFNYVQSKAFDDLLYTDRNFVICAPTGSGKTVVFELAITRLLMEVPLPWSNIKIVYMAPIKALCSQRFDDWKEKFGPIGLNCKELTGDTVMDDLFEIQHAHIIMTTPEKWDSMTRKWRDNSLVQLVRLFLIDEVHVVKDENRGPTLEVVVSRMKTVQSLSPTSENSSTIIPMRFVAVSATIPNAEDIAEWLSDGERPAVCLKMDERHRPVKLRKVVLGFPCRSNQTEFKFDLTLNYKIASVIQTYSDQKPTLVFCATRKGVQQAASVLVKDAKFIMAVEQKQRLQKCAYSIRDSKLRDILIHGVAYHHAGMELSDRKVVEGAFTVGDLPVLFTTSTLAMGVNLPAHLVVIKSTMHYAGGMFEEYSETDILQMIGRAGRPQFDTTATAVIMTRLSTKERYIQMLACSDTVESSLHRHLIEHLNAEIVLHTITDVNIALEWIRSTLLYIRALKNPSHYGFASGLNKDGIEAKLQELCLKNLNDLSSLDLIRMDEDINFKPTEAGRLMAWYYITFETVKKFCTISGKETLLDLIARYSDVMAEILVTIILRNFEQLQTKRTAPDSHYVTLIIGDADNQLVFKHRIMDSVLLKAGNWTKKIDVKRALKSEDLCINLISSEYVGLDIQRKFTVFYLGPKRLGNQIIMQKKSETEISHSKHSNRSTIAGPNKGMTACKKPGNRECNHHCKNKRTCGHDCCKTGVAQKSEIKEPTISSYLSDLRSRNAVSSLPPVKRLKMQMNKSQSVDLKEFGFTPKPSLPSISRSECLNIPELSIMEQRDQHEICAEVQQEPSEYQNKDFSRWNYPTTSDEKAPQTVLFNRHLNASGNQNLTDVGKSNAPFSEVLNVNFELGDEVWDDFDDENLLEVASFSASTEKTKTSGFGNTLSSSTGGNKLFLQESKSQFQGETAKSFVPSHEKPDIYLSNSPVFKCDASSMKKLPQQAGNASIVHLQERKQQSLSPEIEKLCFTHSKKIPNSSHFKEVDFFIRNSECKEDIDFSRYHPDDEADEMKSFLGIFDDIF
ncbi:probable ATP-dependent DNA helicase HFM1 isoform X12 [Ailuropoda melanoleuca]|uniref:probable ATP-dependent DNA helicase HFM1 isoform X12 n=1 Tax=Ailuropoda melanoleuca TaxID=9646 RepID=UPI0014941C8A|nr:probable ATP-dependent DNA helicase HFM1 isoform X12 [Ailuropoda melanoleuca]